MIKKVVLLCLILVCAVAYSAEPFYIGWQLDLRFLSSISEDYIVRKTIGGISDDARNKYKTVEEYIYARRISSISGKGFEAFVAIDFNRNNSNVKLIPTAALNSPQSPVDAVLVEVVSGEVIDLYQMKIGYEIAIKAIFDEKYKDCRVLVPKDIYIKLTQDYRKEVKRAISEGRLTYKIGNISVENRLYYEELSMDYIKQNWNN